MTPTHTPTWTFTPEDTPTSTPTPPVDVTIGKGVSKDVARSGETLMFTVSLAVYYNPAQAVTVTDALPSDVTFLSFAPGTPEGTVAGGVITWFFPTLAPGNHTLVYFVRVNDFVASGTVLRNRADLAYAGHPDPEEASASAKVLGDFTVRVGVYNEAGELVREILVTQFSQPVEDVQVEDDDIIGSIGDVVTLYFKDRTIGVWDGTNQDGQQVMNGVYTVKVDNIDQFGVVDSVVRQVTVDRPLARVDITVYNEAGEAVRHLLGEISDPTNLVMAVRLSSNVIEPSYNPAGPGVVTEVAVVLSNGVAVIWDGRNDNGTIVANGQYYVEVRSEDGKGGEVSITREVTVLGAGARAGEVLAYPNPVSGGEAGVTFKVRTEAAWTVRVLLYDTAGELVKKVSGEAGTNGAFLDTGEVASGLYVAVVEILQPGAGVIDRQIRKVVVLK